MQPASLAREMQQCIDECLHCQRICMEIAMNHCLTMEGRHVEHNHFHLMMNCAEICHTSAEFMMSSSPLYADMRRLCG